MLVPEPCMPGADHLDAEGDHALLQSVHLNFEGYFFSHIYNCGSLSPLSQNYFFLSQLIIMFLF